MENQRPLKKKLRSVLLAAAGGAVVFAALSLGVFIGGHFWPTYLGEISFQVWLTLWVIILQAGISEPTGGSFWTGPDMLHLYLVVLSAFLRSLLFAMVAAFWQFLLKNPYEK